MSLAEPHSSTRTGIDPSNPIAIDRSQIGPDRPQTLDPQRQSTPDRFLKSSPPLPSPAFATVPSHAFARRKSLIYWFLTIFTLSNPLISSLSTFRHLCNPLISRLCTGLHANKKFFLFWRTQSTFTPLWRVRSTRYHPLNNWDGKFVSKARPGCTLYLLRRAPETVAIDRPKLVVVDQGKIGIFYRCKHAT